MLNIKTFALAGNATFTVTSRRTGTRFTFKVRESKDHQRHYVKVLTGSDNENSYSYFGTIFNGVDFRHGRPDATRISPQAPSAIAFAWLWQHINADLSQAVEIHHAGKCCRCGRKLTVPESIESGIGPECAQHVAGL